jgi:Mitochondrial carrier protein
MVAAFATHPIDSIKVRLQLQGELKSSEPKKYNGLIRGISTILKEEGLLGLYRGLHASLLREGTYSTIRMGLYHPIKDLIKSPSDVTEPLSKKVFAGAVSGAIGAVIANPTDLLKVRLQAEPPTQKSTGLIKMALAIIKKDGFIGLYRGVGPTYIHLTQCTTSRYCHGYTVTVLRPRQRTAA